MKNKRKWRITKYPLPLSSIPLSLLPPPPSSPLPLAASASASDLPRDPEVGLATLLSSPTPPQPPSTRRAHGRREGFEGQRRGRDLSLTFTCLHLVCPTRRCRRWTSWCSLGGRRGSWFGCCPATRRGGSGLTGCRCSSGSRGLKLRRKSFGSSQSKLFYRRFVKWFSRCKLSISSLKKLKLP